MAYVSISNTAIDQDSPITVSLMTALRDNPTAIANGDSGAPKIQTAGINDSAVTTAKIADIAVTAAKIADNSVGTSELIADSVTFDKLAQMAASNAYVLKRVIHPSDTAATTYDWTVAKTGVYRVAVKGEPDETAAIKVNGSTVTTLSSFTESSEQTYDVSVNAGQTLGVTISATTGLGDGSVTLEIRGNQPFDFYLREIY